MYITLTGAVVATILDATLILGLGPLHGAAISAFVSHLAMLAVGLWLVVRTGMAGVGRIGTPSGTTRR